MTHEIWRSVPYKTYSHYQVSNLGKIYNTRNDRYLSGYTVTPNSKLLYIHLNNGSKFKRLPVHKLVAMTFKHLTKKYNTAYHINYTQDDNRTKNLEKCTVGQAVSRTRLYNNAKKKKIKGVYKWNGLVNKWRVMFSLGKMKVKTFGYYKTRKEAVAVYKKEFTEYYGFSPFKERNIHNAQTNQ